MASNTATITFDTVSDMTAAIGSVANERATLLGYTSAGDDGGGEFYYASGSSATVDNGVVFSTSGTGRWIRLFNTSLNPRYFGAKGDGTTDDSTAFNNCLASTYSSHVDVSDGTYIVQNLAINSARTVTLTAGATLKLKASAGANPIVTVNSTAQFTKISGGVFDGNKANQSSTNTCIEIAADDVTVQNCQVIHSSWMGIHGIANRPFILNNNVQDTNYIGIFFQTSGANVEGGVIEGNTVDRSMLTNTSIVEGGLKVHGDTTFTVKNWRLANNLVKLPISPTAAACVCIEVQNNASNCVVSNNITVGGQIGVSVGAPYSPITGNILNAASLYGIEAGVSFITITGNAVYAVDVTSGTVVTERGITIDGVATNCTISANTIYDTTQNAIYLTASRKYIAITGNSINLSAAGPTVPYAINMEGTCSFINISGNQFFGNAITAKGILFNDGTYITISSNSFDSFTQNGILMAGSGSNITDNISVMNNVFHSVNVAFAFQMSGTSSMGNNISVFGNAGIKNYLDFKNEVLLITGSGTPQAVVTASVGAQFLRNDGGASTTLYIKESGTNTNTGWVGK
jgi:hypothetical protein